MSIRKIPDAIWLQWPEDRNVDRETVSWADVTWAENAIEDTDPKYLRSTPAREAAPKLLDACKELTVAIVAIRARLSRPRNEREQKAVDELFRLFNKGTAAIRKAEDLP